MAFAYRILSCSLYNMIDKLTQNEFFPKALPATDMLQNKKAYRLSDTLLFQSFSAV